MIVLSPPCSLVVLHIQRKNFRRNKEEADEQATQIIESYSRHLKYLLSRNKELENNANFLCDEINIREKELRQIRPELQELRIQLADSQRQHQEACLTIEKTRMCLEKLTEAEASSTGR